jgi:hypothetical protein
MAAQPCPTCEGAGKLDSKNKKSWNQFRGIPYGDPRMKGVASGEIVPENCSDCAATGVKQEAGK